jgi:hypothetical protein
VKPVALDTVVLCDQITFGNSSVHFPFLLNKHLLIPENTKPFALSTAPLDCGWYTEENFEGITIELFPIIHSQFSWNPESANYVLPEEFLNCWRRDICQSFRFYPFGEIVHNHNCEFAVSLSCWQWSSFAKAMRVELDELTWMVSFADSLFSDMLHIPKPIFCIYVYGRLVKSLLYSFAC